MRLLLEIVRAVIIAVVSVGVGVVVAIAMDRPLTLIPIGKGTGQLILLGSAAGSAVLTGIGLLRLWPPYKT